MLYFRGGKVHFD